MTEPTKPEQGEQTKQWENELFRYIWATDGTLLCNPEKLAEITHRIYTEGINSVICQRCVEHRDIPSLNNCASGAECPICALSGVVPPSWDKGLNLPQRIPQPAPAEPAGVADTDIEQTPQQMARPRRMDMMADIFTTWPQPREPEAAEPAAPLGDARELERYKQSAWVLLYEVCGELPIPPEKGWMIGAMYLRDQERIAALQAELAEAREKLAGAK